MRICEVNPCFFDCSNDILFLSTHVLHNKIIQEPVSRHQLARDSYDFAMTWWINHIAMRQANNVSFLQSVPLLHNYRHYGLQFPWDESQNHWNHNYPELLLWGAPYLLSEFLKGYELFFMTLRGVSFWDDSSKLMMGCLKLNWHGVYLSSVEFN